jgi:type VI secretion system secreted protein Hcp
MTGVAKDCIRAICLGSVILLGANLLATGSAFANQFFMSIEGIAGDSRDSTHPGWIPLTKIQWNGLPTETASSGAASGNAAGRSRSLTATKMADKSSSALFAAVAAGKHFRSVMIDELNSAHHVVLKISMQDVIISSVRQGAGGSIPTETLTLQFVKVSITGSNATPRTGTLSQQIQ